MTYRYVKVLAAALITVAATVAGCADEPETGPITSYDDRANVLNIVAGSEHEAVFERIVRPWCAEQGLTCTMTRLGSVDQARLLDGGDAPYDAFWFASSVFQQLGDTGHRLREARPMFGTPLVFAGRRAELDALGFTGRDVGIEEILAAVETKRTTAWMTNPTQSNSGATVLLGFLNYFAGNGPGEPLTREQLDSEPVRAGITRFARAFAKTPPSTGLLMDECLAAPQRCKTLFTYEDLVIERNQELVRSGQEPLHVIYPAGVLAISDAPLGFLPHGDNPEKLRNFQRLQDFLLDADTQRRLAELGRRPITSIGLSLPDAPTTAFDPAWGIRATLTEQPITYPSAPVINAALENYQTVYRTPTDLVYCIDASSSMAGNEGWAGVRRAADLLFDPVESKKYLLQTGPKDRTAILLFDQDTHATPWIRGNAAGELEQLRDAVHYSKPRGQTGIYRCLSAAADQFSGPAEPDRKQLIILMTDGADTEGGDGLDTVARTGIPVVVIGFGSDVKEDALREIAQRTGGSYLTSDDMVAALRQATGYR
ncbi:VWA domain-containing protein [Nocardia sp. CC227C]|uniref:VWA domain-containing protein n=1 Tax=Nocardia sp. CC227C TaxID=3044562 RepID=UPI00278C53DB|nr:VWA domain-containing protein [Nocardia sp. CC227C]